MHISLTVSLSVKLSYFLLSHHALAIERFTQNDGGRINLDKSILPSKMNEPVVDCTSRTRVMMSLVTCTWQLERAEHEVMSLTSYLQYTDTIGLVVYTGCGLKNDPTPKM